MSEKESVQDTNSDPQVQSHVLVQPETVPTPTEKKPRPWLIVSLAFLLTISIGVAGYFAYQNFQLKKSLVQTETMPQINTPSPTPTIDQTVTWQKYQNKEMKFRIKYPPHWGVSESGLYGPDGKISSRPFIIWGEPKELSGVTVYSMYLFLEDNPKELSSRDFVNELIEKNKNYEGPGGLSYKEVKHLNINGMEATELDGVFAYDQNEERIYIAHKDKVYVFSFPVASENQNLLKPIENNKLSHIMLSSFEILE